MRLITILLLALLSACAPHAVVTEHAPITHAHDDAPLYPEGCC